MTAATDNRVWYASPMSHPDMPWPVYRERISGLIGRLAREIATITSCSQAQHVAQRASDAIGTDHPDLDLRASALGLRRIATTRQRAVAARVAIAGEIELLALWLARQQEDRR